MLAKQGKMQKKRIFLHNSDKFSNFAIPFVRAHYRLIPM